MAAAQWPWLLCAASLHILPAAAAASAASAAAASAAAPSCLASAAEGDGSCRAASGDDESLLIQTRGRRASQAPGDTATPAMLPTTPCYYSNSSDHCSFEGLPKDKPTLIYPGGSTTCLFGDPYKFTVYPGSGKKDKLLLFFAGGGACWKTVATGKGNMGCFTDIGAEAQGSGIFDRSNSQNPFKDYAIVFINYCTGDVHTGAADDVWEVDGKKMPVKLQGYHNVMSALDWVAGNFGTTTLVVGGTSAGSLGVYFWAEYLLQRLPYVQAAVFTDSYAGVFPAGTQGGIIQSWGSCGALRLMGLKAEMKMCNEEKKKDALLLIYSSTISKFKSVRFGSIQSKGDSLQRAFDDMVASSEGMTEPPLSAVGLYDKSNNIFKQFKEASPSGNFAVFYVDGDTHMLTPQTFFYTTTTEGINHLSQGGTGLAKWMEGFADPGAGPSPQFACNGELMDEPIPNSTSWCLKSLE